MRHTIVGAILLVCDAGAVLTLKLLHMPVGEDTINAAALLGFVGVACLVRGALTDIKR